MSGWLRRNLKARRAFVEALILVAFIVGYDMIKDARRARGWWPDSFLADIAVAVVLGVVMGLALRALQRRK
jgi:hypothetical protein